MKEISFIVFGSLSLAFVILAIIIGCLVAKKQKSRSMAVRIATLFVFPAVVCLFIPAYYTSYDLKDSITEIRPFLLSVYTAFRIFLFDGDYDFLRDSLAGCSEWVHFSFSLQAAILFVAAPVLTLSNVLAFFKNVIAEIRYWRHKWCRIYVMSELNEKSLALAKSIREKHEKTDEKAVLVFTDVFEKNEEQGYELLEEARRMRAICLKKDILHLDIKSKKGIVELFLIGENEAENVSQAVQITNELNSDAQQKKNAKQNVKIFVFARSASSAYIIDSTKYDALQAYASENKYGENTFRLRRVDEIQQMVWSTVPQMDIFRMADRQDKCISILLVGMGEYGIEFFKMLVWYCQMEGYRLELNLVDKIKEGEEGSIRAILARQCPELLATNPCHEEGDADYSIEFFSGVDIKTDQLGELLQYEGTDPAKKEQADRLKRTTNVIITLGDDDKNIDAAVYLRSLFDRVHGIKKEDVRDKDYVRSFEEEIPQIYAVVYDEQKAGILTQKNENVDPDEKKNSGKKQEEKQKNRLPNFLTNHAEEPYNIHFIGSLSDQFSYDHIYEKEIEKEAYENHHVGWARIEGSIQKRKENDAKGVPDEEKYKKDFDLKKAKQGYERFEYYRLSSIGKEIHKKMKETLFESLIKCQEAEETVSCECPNCKRSRKVEHARWNAYMRTIGYEYRPYRADRARVHDKIKAQVSREDDPKDSGKRVGE